MFNNLALQMYCNTHADERITQRLIWWKNCAWDEKAVFSNSVIDECAALHMQMKESLTDWSDEKAVFNNSTLTNVSHKDVRIHEWQSLIS